MKNLPVMFTWIDGHMVPHERFANICKRQFADGEEYPLEVVQHRSMASHNQYFAALHDGFLNLNEAAAKQFATENHLRAWALIQTGYCMETDFVCDTPLEAKRLAAFVRKREPYAVIKLSECVVKVFEAESQSMQAMKKERFEQSKRDVLDLVASMARTTRPTLMKNAGRSA